VGCANCYKVFREAARQLAYRSHGRVEHLGKIPVVQIDRAAKLKEIERLEKLKKQYADADQLEEAIAVKNNIANDYMATMQSMESDIVDLVIEVAQKVVAKEIKKPDYIVGLVSEAIEKVSSKKDTILKVSEADYDYILENKEKILFLNNF
jgi:flagellar assembly protein FliH